MPATGELTQPQKRQVGSVSSSLMIDVDRLVAVEIEVHRPSIVAVAEVESPGSVTLVTKLGDGHACPLSGRTLPNRSALVDGDALSPRGHLESDLVFDSVGDAVSAAPLDLFDVEVGEDGGHPRG